MRFSLRSLMTHTLCLGLGGSIGALMVEHKLHDAITTAEKHDAELYRSIQREQAARANYEALFHSKTHAGLPGDTQRTTFLAYAPSSVTVEWDTRYIRIQPLDRP